MDIDSILLSIKTSSCFAEVRNSGALPDADGDDGYYFVSYSHLDYKSVIPDIIAFRRLGLKIWYDRGLEAGKSWLKEVSKKIPSYYCKGVIAYLSENYLRSASCITELKQIMQEKKGCVFVVLDPAYKTYENKDLPEPLLSFMERSGCADGKDPASVKADLLKKIPEPELFLYNYYLDDDGGERRLSCTVARLLDCNLQSVTVPPFVEKDGEKCRVHGIAGNAFSGCEMLEEVTLSDGWTEIAPHAFSRCPSLRTLKLGKPHKIQLNGYDRVVETGIVNNAFDRCESVTNIECPDGFLVLDRTFERDPSIVEFTAPDNYIIGAGCFSRCAALERVKLSRRSALGEMVFYDCCSLRKVELPTETNFAEVGALAFYGCRLLESITLPENIKKICAGAFTDCAALTAFTLPENTEYVAPSAFSGCDGILEVTVNTDGYDFLTGEQDGIDISDGASVNSVWERQHRDEFIDETSLLPLIPKKVSKNPHSVIHTALDELFPSAERFYLRVLPPADAFRGSFAVKESDRAGYLLYEKTHKGEQR